GVGGEENGNVLEDTGVVAKIPKLGDGHADVVRVGVANVVIDANELLGMWERERLEKDGVYDGKDGDVGADAEGESQDGDESEAGASTKHARGVAKILAGGFDPADDVHSACVLFHESRVAEAALGIVAGFAGRHA